MNNMFKNKKIVIPLIVVIIVIIIAIVAFVFVGMNGKNNKKENSKIKFNEDTVSENSTNNTNTSKNEKKDSDDKIGADVDEFYKEAIKKFIAGYMDKNDMETFLEDCLDSKAYLAYHNIDGDDSKFYDKYMSIADDDEKVKEITETFKKMPEAYKMIFGFIDMMGAMAENMNTTNTTNSENTIDSGNVSVNITSNVADLSEEDKEIKLVDIKKPEQSKGDDEISSIVFTISFLGEEMDLTMVFYGDTVIYICDEDGVSILESTANSGLDNESNLDLFGLSDEEQ